MQYMQCTTPQENPSSPGLLIKYKGIEWHWFRALETKSDLNAVFPLTHIGCRADLVIPVDLRPDSPEYLPDPRHFPLERRECEGARRGRDPHHQDVPQGIRLGRERPAHEAGLPEAGRLRKNKVPWKGGSLAGSGTPAKEPVPRAAAQPASMAGLADDETQLAQVSLTGTAEAGRLQKIKAPKKGGVVAGNLSQQEGGPQTRSA